MDIDAGLIVLALSNIVPWGLLKFIMYKVKKVLHLLAASSEGVDPKTDYFGFMRDGDSLFSTKKMAELAQRFGPHVLTRDAAVVMTGVCEYLCGHMLNSCEGFAEAVQRPRICAHVAHLPTFGDADLRGIFSRVAVANGGLMMSIPPEQQINWLSGTDRCKCPNHDPKPYSHVARVEGLMRVRAMQKLPAPIISSAAMCSLILEIGKEEVASMSDGEAAPGGGARPLEWSAEAGEALRAVTEAHLVSLVRGALASLASTSAPPTAPTAPAAPAAADASSPSSPSPSPSLSPPPPPPRVFLVPADFCDLTDDRESWYRRKNVALFAAGCELTGPSRGPEGAPDAGVGVDIGVSSAEGGGGAVPRSACSASAVGLRTADVLRLTTSYL